MATGLLLPSREVLLWAESDLSRLVRSAVAAEDAGFDSVWVGDSLLARPRGEPLALLAAIAGATRRVRLGTAVLLPLLRHPVSLAHQVATLDRISGGRVILGIGPGAELPGTHAELKSVGVPSERRVTAMIASIERCRRLWSNEEPGIELLPRPINAVGPPIWYGGSGPRMLRTTGTSFDGWIPLSPTPADYAAGLQTIRESAVSAGRDPDSIARAVYLTLSVASTQRAADVEMDAYIRAYYGVPAEVMARGMALHAGTVASAQEWVAAYRAAGADHVVIRLARPDLSDYDGALGGLLEAAR